MTRSTLSFRVRLLLGSVLPALIMVLLLGAVFFDRYQNDLESVFQERGYAVAHQIGAAAEYALFSGSHDTLGRLADVARQSDPTIVVVTVFDATGRQVAHSGAVPLHRLPLINSPQVYRGDRVTALQTPVFQTILQLQDELSDVRPPEQKIVGYIAVEIARDALEARKREMLEITLAIMLGGLLLASWLSLRIAHGVLTTLDTAQKALRRQMETAELLARTDALTGLANRRAFDEVAQQEIQRAQRYGTPLTLVLADLDHFKAINDSHGHDVGDCVLQDFARILAGSVRNVDLVGRWGGEEFAILMPGTDLTEATQAAERMRRQVEQAQLCIEETTCRYTASFGVAAFRADMPTLASLLGRADMALYRAKRLGRNRVEVG
ncbi:sensor domain-containing diguanylate cyclase [Sulfuricystis thermophila]|uniref:sensor domain-containing diguanylate cyclase n=1 Tax=Sulfuricystis thermophila TaxID=2496847 RepID=UPI001035CD5A|nr:diguanylate cyclase [Sulfuricystis thermophila]